MKRTRVAAIATLLALTTAACGDDPEPNFAPPEPSPSPSEVQTSEPPSEPPKALSPEDTVRAWVDARNRALNTGDVGEVRQLSAASCSSCDDLINSIVEVYSNGGDFDTKGWRVIRSRVVSQETTSAEVSAGLALAGGQTISEVGAEPVAYPPEKEIATFQLSRADGVWKLGQIGFLS